MQGYTYTQPEGSHASMSRKLKAFAILIWITCCFKKNDVMNIWIKCKFLVKTSNFFLPLFYWNSSFSVNFIWVAIAFRAL